MILDEPGRPNLIARVLTKGRQEGQPYSDVMLAAEVKVMGPGAWECRKRKDQII